MSGKLRTPESIGQGFQLLVGENVFAIFIVQYSFGIDEGHGSQNISDAGSGNA